MQPSESSGKRGPGMSRAVAGGRRRELSRRLDIQFLQVTSEMSTGPRSSGSAGIARGALARHARVPPQSPSGCAETGVPKRPSFEAAAEGDRSGSLVHEYAIEASSEKHPPRVWRIRGWESLAGRGSVFARLLGLCLPCVIRMSDCRSLSHVALVAPLPRCGQWHV